MKMNQKKKKITNKANKKRYTVSESSYNNRAYVNKKDIFFMCTEKKCHKGNEKNLPSTCDKKDFGSAYLTDL